MQKLFDEWMSSEDAPYHRDAGDFNKIFSHALRFVTGKVSAEHADMAAEKLTNMFHGEEDDGMSESVYKTDITAYLSKQKGGDWKATTADLEKEKSAGKISHRDTLAKNRGVGEGAYYGPEDFQDWLKDATHRVAQGRVSDWTELAAELSTELGFDDDKSDRIAQRIYGHDKLAQYRVKPQDDLEKDIPRDDGEDDDSTFLNKLRSQARSGSIKPGADTGEKDESVGESPMNALQEVAQLVMGFYDRDNGTWTKGEHGVVTHVKRQFSDEEGNGGEREAELAAKLIQHLNAKHESTQQFEDIKKLAGLKIAEEKTVERDPKTGKVTSWKDEGEWKKSTAKKDPRGKVTNMSDKARRETEKMAASSSKK
jgi:hypothetical protein